MTLYDDSISFTRLSIDDPYQFIPNKSLENQLEETSRQIIEYSTENNVHVSTAESCTAGLLSATIANIPGASNVLLGGVCTYNNKIKNQILHIPYDILEAKTAVCYEVGYLLAYSSRNLFNSDLSCGITGYAGPGGGTTENPVGTVYIGIDSIHHQNSFRVSFSGNRLQIRKKSVLFALQKMLLYIQDL